MKVDVYVSNGLRKIKPYYHHRSSFVKGRWLGRTLLDVLTDEFKSFSKEHYVRELQNMNYRLLRDGVPLSVEEIFTMPIRNKDVIETTTHKHEPPVKAWECAKNGASIAGLRVLFENDDLLVVDKPNGLPVHPTGQYYYNTLTETLKAHGQPDVYPCYRLDRVTSGVMILAKNQQTASSIQDKIRSHEMNKWYLSRVDGLFPHMNNSTTIGEPFSRTDYITIVDSPTFTIDLKRQFPEAISQSKPATTLFYPIKYLPAHNQTIVACKPLTGRTHQIRIHLARLGYPIANDTFYNLNITDFPKRVDFLLHHIPTNDTPLDPLRRYFDIFSQEAHEHSSKEASSLGKCEMCGITLKPDLALAKTELWLHAWKYFDISGEISFQTEMPSWTY